MVSEGFDPIDLLYGDDEDFEAGLLRTITTR
jgi:hypothetical protein